MPNEDIAKPDFIPVVGQHDLSIAIASETFHIVELAVRHPGVPLLAADVRFYDQPAVQPMFDAAPADDNASTVPLARWIQDLMR